MGWALVVQSHINVHVDLDRADHKRLVWHWRIVLSHPEGSWAEVMYRRLTQASRGQPAQGSVDGLCWPVDVGVLSTVRTHGSEHDGWAWASWKLIFITTWVNFWPAAGVSPLDMHIAWWILVTGHICAFYKLRRWEWYHPTTNFHCMMSLSNFWLWQPGGVYLKSLTGTHNLSQV